MERHSDILCTGRLWVVYSSLQKKASSAERVPENNEVTAKTLEDSLSQISTAHKRYQAECDRITAELAAVEVRKADIPQILAWAADIRTAIEGDAISFHAKRLIIERLNVTAKIEYQNNGRGLRIECPVLACRLKWKKT